MRNKILTFIVGLTLLSSLFCKATPLVGSNQLESGTIGTIKKVGIDDIELYVYDVNKDGHLTELQNAITYARSYTSALISVASGSYLLDTCLIINYSNRKQEIRGNNTLLYVRQGYTGEAISITSTGDLTDLAVSGLKFAEYGTPARLWTGINIALGTGQDLQMSKFSFMRFDNLHTILKINLTGTGWANANTFLGVDGGNFIQVTETETPTGTAFEGNKFIACEWQSFASTTVGIDTLESSFNTFLACEFWDAQLSSSKGIIFGTTGHDNYIAGGSLPGHNGYIDLNGNNILDCKYVTAVNASIRRNSIHVNGYGWIDSLEVGHLVVPSIEIASSFAGDANVKGLNYSGVDESVGVMGQSYATSGTGMVAGVRGIANGTAAGTTNVGVWGTAIDGGTNWAGYFQGGVYLSDFLYLVPAVNPPSGVEGRIYADTDHHLYYYNGTTWVQLDN